MDPTDKMNPRISSPNSGVVFKVPESEAMLNSDDDISSPVTYTNEEGQTVFVTLTDPIISDQEISVSDAGTLSDSNDLQSSIPPSSGAVLDVLVTTVNGIDEELGESHVDLEKDSSMADISQQWITSKNDKISLQEKGHMWKQGQWTSEENDVLRNNIASYCQENGIKDANSIIFEMTKDMRKDFYRVIARGLDRPLFAVYRRVIRMYDQKNHVGKYSQDEIAKLRELRLKHGNDWSTIGAALGRSAGSVRDRCRLMKDSCRYGTWQHDEELRLSSAVYELSGVQPGEEVHHGLCWADVAAKVKTRTEKQCRAKWLNFLNWKQKGGAEWAGASDDKILLSKIIALNCSDESHIDWILLSKGWACVRSPQWLRSKWWALKRRVPNYQNMTFSNILGTLNLMTSSGKDGVIGTDGSINLLTTPIRLCSSDGFRLAPTVQLPDGSHAVLAEDFSVDASPLHFITSTNAYLITNPVDSLSFPLTAIPAESLIVHTLPLNECSSSAKDNVTEMAIDHPSHNADEIVLLDEVQNISESAHDREDASDKHKNLTSVSDPLLNCEQTDSDENHEKMKVSKANGLCWNNSLSV